MVDFAGSHVVVTGGTGALGRAVIGALRAVHAVCHVPNLVAAELDDFPYASDPGVHVGRGVDLGVQAFARPAKARAFAPFLSARAGRMLMRGAIPTN